MLQPNTHRTEGSFEIGKWKWEKGTKQRETHGRKLEKYEPSLKSKWGKSARRDLHWRGAPD